MLLRSAALPLLVLMGLFSGVCSPKVQSQSQPPAMKTFREQDFNLTFIYPADFVAVDPKTPAPAIYSLPATKAGAPDAPCVHTPLSVGSNGAGNSALVFSIIDDACPGILRDAQKLGDFVHTQLLRQLQRYGTPTITQDSRLYTFDNRPAAVILGSATPIEQLGASPQAGPSSAKAQAQVSKTTYAAKVCLFGKVPAYTFGKPPRELTAAHSVLCFDFTSRRADLLQPLLYLPLVFEDLAPRSLVPAALLR